MSNILGFMGVLLSLILWDGCSPDQDQHAGEQVAVKEWIKLDHAVLGVDNNALFTISPQLSGNKQWLYLPTRGFGGEIITLDIGQDFPRHVVDKGRWSKLTWQDSKFDGTAGYARFSDNGSIRTINATREGLAVAWHNRDPGARSGALYARGKKLEYAWSSNAHLIAGLSNELIDNFIIIDYKGRQNPYVLVSVDVGGGIRQSRLFASNNLGNNKLDVTVGPGNTAESFSLAKFAQNDQYAFLVSQSGISWLDVADAGTTKAFSAVVKNTPVYGSDFWNMGDPTTDNFNVSSVKVHNGLLYVGLLAIHNNQGGVAIYDSARKTVIGPSRALWNGVSVLDIVTGPDGLVWALTKKELIEVKPNGEMGQKLNADVVASEQANLAQDNPKSGYVGKMPSQDFFGAVYVDQHLLLLTEKDVYVMIAKTMQTQ